MTILAALVGDFAVRSPQPPGNEERLTVWIDQARAEDLPHLHAFTRGLEFDRHAVNAARTQPFHNGCTEGVNTKKMIKRQMRWRRLSPTPPHPARMSYRSHHRMCAGADSPTDTQRVARCHSVSFAPRAVARSTS